VSLQNQVRTPRTGTGWRVFHVLLAFAALLSAAGLIGRSMFEVASPPPRQQVASTASDDQLYTGSITFVPPAGNDCWQRLLDNRTGQQWDKGTVPCDAAPTGLISRPGRYTATERVDAIRKGFRRE
jgi:hypothetical protein